MKRDTRDRAREEKGEEREKEKEKSNTKKYVFSFLMLCLVFYLFYYLTTGSGLMLHVRTATALILASIFSLAGMDVAVKGTILSVNGFSLDIIDECTAVFPAIIYCSCILAYPARLKKKSLGILIGVPALYAINLFRIAILTFVGLYNPNMMEFVHVYLWQGSFIIFVVVLFLIWLKIANESGEG